MFYIWHFLVIITFLNVSQTYQLLNIYFSMSFYEMLLCRESSELS